jgi:hypothetical protein
MREMPRTEREAIEPEVELVVLLGRLGAQLAVFREQFVARFGPKAVQTAVECKAYDTGPMIEVWAELSCDRERVTWWMDLVPTDRAWRISGHVTVSSDETLFDLEDRGGLSFSELLAAAPHALTELLAVKPAILAT